MTLVKLVACVSVARAPATFLEDAWRDDGSRYVVSRCQTCECEIYLGLRSKALILGEPLAYRLICMDCLAALQLATGAEIHMHPLSSGGMSE